MKVRGSIASLDVWRQQKNITIAENVFQNLNNVLSEDFLDITVADSMEPDVNGRGDYQYPKEFDFKIVLSADSAIEDHCDAFNLKILGLIFLPGIYILTANAYGRKRAWAISKKKHLCFWNEKIIERFILRAVISVRINPGDGGERFFERLLRGLTVCVDMHYECGGQIELRSGWHLALIDSNRENKLEQVVVHNILSKDFGLDNSHSQVPSALVLVDVVLGLCSTNIDGNIIAQSSTDFCLTSLIPASAAAAPYQSSTLL
ncbi:unnamed protein product [Ilex paraguariensis]|uniref:Uncharacterized protein n=1 Tax=Ilex paraguariensis TaxID=185542 RepID=A0ABC8QS61_9AQUA